MLPEVKYITAGVDLSTIDPFPGTIPEFDFSKAQLSRHRVRAGLETPEQYEERRALINSIIAEHPQ
jgi:hypothetical protein